MVQTANLSSLTARLVLQSNNLLRTNVSQNDKIEKAIWRATLTEIENIVIGMPSLNIETNTLNEFHKYINAVLIRLDLTRQVALVIQKTEALRWLHIDIEDEATALVADFTFNVKTLTGILVRTKSRWLHG